MKIKLKKFSMKNIPDGSNLYFVGKKKTGKSFLIRDYLWHKRDVPVATVISPTESANCFFGKIIPKMFIHDEYTPELTAKVLKRQRMVAKMIKTEERQYGEGNSTIDPRTFLILDDCLYDPRWKKDKSIKYFMFNGRHVYTNLLITSQDSLGGADPAFRGNMDFVFILRQPYYNQRKRIYENFCSIFPTFEMFCKTLDQCTENYECMVINNTVNSSRIEDMVFWYKAEPHDDFKVGAEQYWQFNDQYCDEDSEEEDVDINSYSKKNSVPLDVQKLD